VGAASSAAATVAQARAARKAAEIQSAASTRAAELQTNAATAAAGTAGASNDATLKFEQQKEAERKAEWERVQALNLEQFNADLARRQPYMDKGLGALAQMGQTGAFQRGAGPPQAGAGPGAPYQPLYSKAPPPPGSLGDILAKKQAGA
jgi:Ni/Co efflux regulator RcnB